MFVALFGLLATLIAGGGSLDYFYIDKLDKGVKKEVVDKDRKKDIEADLKSYTKIIDEFYKTQKKQLKDLREKNLIRGVDADYYVNFFNERMQDRIRLQDSTVAKRLILQKKITDEEWDAIMKMATDSETKKAEKEQRKEMKKNDKNVFREQEKAIVENVPDKDRRAILLKGLGVFEGVYDEIVEAYENINVADSDFLTNKYASKEEMLVLNEVLNEQRLKLYEGYAVFIIDVEKNATDEEYKVIMKAFNKLLKA